MEDASLSFSSIRKKQTNKQTFLIYSFSSFSTNDTCYIYELFAKTHMGEPPQSHDAHTKTSSFKSVLRPNWALTTQRPVSETSRIRLSYE